MSLVFSRAEIWSNLQCAGGTRLSIFPSVTSLRYKRAVTGGDQVEMSFPLVHLPTGLAERRILRIVFEENWWEEWRIITTKFQSDESEYTGFLTAMWPDADLASDVLVFREETDGLISHNLEGLNLTPTQHINSLILPSLTAEGLTHFALGTIEGTGDPVDMTYDWDTPLSALRRLAELSNTEFQLRKNGTTNYLIDLLNQIGSTAEVLDLRMGRNLNGVERMLESAEQATRLYPRGANVDGFNADIGDARWKVSAVTAGVDVTLDDPDGGDSPIAFNDQFNGMYIRKTDGSFQLINDTVASSSKLLVSSTTGIAVNDLVTIRRTNTGDGRRLTFLEHPVNKAYYGLISRRLDRDDLPPSENVIVNGSMKVYTTATNAAPDNWTTCGGLASTNVDRSQTSGTWRHGGQSAYVQAAGDGQGIETDYNTILPTTRDPYVSGYVGLRLETSGAKVRVELIAAKSTTATITGTSRSTSGGVTTVTVTTSGAHGLLVGHKVEQAGVTPTAYNGIYAVTAVPSSTQYTYVVGADPGAWSSGGTARQVWIFPDGTDGLAFTTEYQVWVDLGVAGIELQSLGATRIKMRVCQHGATSVNFYVDYAQVTETAGQQAFIDGSGLRKLWQAANLRLATHSVPLYYVNAKIIDLETIEGAPITTQPILVGGTVRLTDDLNWGVVTTRILEVERNALDPTDMQITLSNRPDDLTDTIIRPRLPPRLPRDPIVDTVLSVAASFAPSPSDVTQLSTTLTAQPIGATVYYWRGDKGQQPPPISTLAGGPPTATAWGIYTGAFNIDRDASTNDQQLYAYAVRGNRVSPVSMWTIDANQAPAVTAAISQVSGPNGMRVTWAPDIDVAYVRVYSRRNASTVSWPTSDGTQSAALSNTYFRGTYHVSTNGGGWDASGNVIAGALSYSDTTAYPWANTDKFAVILVPIDRWGNPGTRYELSGTYVTTAPAAIATFTATRTTDGTACTLGSGARWNLAWTEGATAWADGTHDLLLYYSYEGGPYTLITTVTNPHSVASYNFDCETKKSAGKFDPLVSYQFKAELWDTGPNLLDVATAGPYTIQSTCAI